PSCAMRLRPGGDSRVQLIGVDWRHSSGARRGLVTVMTRLRLSPAYVMRQIAASSGTSSPTLGTLYIHSFHPSSTNITYFANDPTIVSFRPGHQHSVTITLSCVCYTRTWGSVSPVRRHNFKLSLTYFSTQDGLLQAHLLLNIIVSVIPLYYYLLLATIVYLYIFHNFIV